MGEVHAVDGMVAVVLGLAVLRGLLLGLIREVFSIGALAGACVVVRLFDAPVGDWLARATAGALGGRAAAWIAGAALAVATIAAVAIAGRLARRGARAAGLGWADRAGGAALGAAEGALVVVLLLLVASAVLGRGHELLAGSRSLAALERVERFADERSLGPVDVAAPPPR